MTIVLDYMGCLLAAGVILLEFLAVRRLLESTKRMEAVFGPLETLEDVQSEGIEEDEQPPTLRIGSAIPDSVPAHR